MISEFIQSPHTVCTPQTLLNLATTRHCAHLPCVQSPEPAWPGIWHGRQVDWAHSTMDLLGDCGLFNLSEPRFLICKNGGNNMSFETCFVGWMRWHMPSASSISKYRISMSGEWGLNEETGRQWEVNGALMKTDRQKGKFFEEFHNMFSLILQPDTEWLGVCRTRPVPLHSNTHNPSPLSKSQQNFLVHPPSSVMDWIVSLKKIC